MHKHSSMKNLLRLVLVTLLLGSVATRAQVQPPPPSTFPVASPQLPQAALAGASSEEIQRLNAGMAYLRSTDEEILKLNAAYSAVQAECMRKIELSRADEEIALYTKLKTFDPKVAAVAETRLAEAVARKKRVEAEITGATEKK